MKNLVTILTEQTQELKKLYIQQIEKWAEVDYTRVVENANFYKKWWHLTEEKMPVDIVQKFRESATYHRKYGYIIIKDGLEKYKTKMVKRAEFHYEDSIIKLVNRLIKKGINENDQLEIVSGWVGINFETTIKHSKGVTRAFTIFAEGEINAPHYRYLIK